eukprot:2824586-Pyramimonas_sp.AAC.1
MQDISKASNITTSRCVYMWEFGKKEKVEMGRTIILRLVVRDFMDLVAFGVWKPSQEQRGGQ